MRVKRRERSARGQVIANIEPPPPPAAYHEEDESGGFETYRGNPHRRLSALPDPRPDDTRRYSDTRLAQACDEAAGSPERGGVYHISVDPLEADIRSLLALEARRAARAARSLPNLRASRETLLPAAPAGPGPAGPVAGPPTAGAPAPAPAAS